jgi:acyl-CoA reductase-like NAD-dependent aldehyde dehydrogenase
MTIDHNHLFIGGQWVAPTSNSRISVIAASTEAVVGSVPEAQEADVDAAVAAANHALADPTGWRQWSPAQRAAAMERLADALERRREDIVQTVCVQNGMPVAQGRQLEAPYPVAVLRYYARLCRDTATEDTRDGLLGGRVVVRREPIGVVAAIVPWNFPQILAALKYAPALASGCAVVLKPAPETVLDSYVLAECVVEAGIPDGVINIVPAGRGVGAYLVSHPGIDKVSFTGSTAAGKCIGEQCAKLLRPASLELGGKSAAIILDDANLDLEAVGAQLFAATLLNNGQGCFLSTRVLASGRRYAEIVDLLTDFAKTLKIGDALDDATQIGPMATAAQRERVESFIAKGVGEGARITTGGGRPSSRDRGWFVEPTIFADVDNGHTIAQQEIFGPVLSIIRYSDDQDAVDIANDSDFGLAGTIWTSDAQRGLELARRIHTGTIGVNKYLPDPVGPFGGVKASGIGSELGPEGLTPYRQLKSIYVD